jgi:signal transduction histidine kinase
MDTHVSTSSTHQRSHPEATTRELMQLRHDLRQYVAAGLLLTQVPDGELLEPAVRLRLERLDQIFSRMRELTAASVSAAEQPPPVWVDLVELVDECVSYARIAHGVPLAVDADGPIEAVADPVMLRRAVNNVLDNASRAAGASGHVRVRVDRRRSQAIVEISDDGDGFGRIPSLSGQGMSIVDQALRACHGRLEISSGPGPGTTVRLLIPALVDGREAAS